MNTDEILEKLNENSKECIIQNRRKGPDFLLQVVNLAGIIMWFFILMLLAMCDKIGMDLFDFSKNNISTKEMRLLNMGLVMATIMFFISATLLLISLKRTRRKNDKIKISLLLSEVISFLIGILLLIKLY